MEGFIAYSKKTGTDAHYEVIPRTQQSISRWPYSAHLEVSSFCGQVVAVKGSLSATHFMCRPKATLINARTKKIRVVQILLRHFNLDKHYSIPWS